MSEHVVTQNPATLQTRYEILRMETISVDKIIPHSMNPRPAFHLTADDDNLLALGDSIKVSGQSTLALVFEQIDNPGHYILLQGERRWRACKLVGVETLKCNVATTPITKAEELEWLGLEEAFKQPWQPFFVLRHAWQVANEHGIAIDHPEMPTKTGLSMSDLKTAKKVFSLSKEIQQMCINYEENLYKTALDGKRRRGRAKLLYMDGSRVPEFPVSKAAVVWDIYEAFKENYPSLVKDYTTEDLQVLIANRATRIGSSLRDLEQFLAAIKTPNPPAGLLTQISVLLENPKKSLKEINKVAGTEELKSLNIFIKHSITARKNMESVLRSKSRLGMNVDYLRDAHTEVLRLINDASALERAISEQISRTGN